jgi:hypothetical protein
MKLTTTELNEKELKQLSGCRFLVGEFDNILSFDIKKNRFFSVSDEYGGLCAIIRLTDNGDYIMADLGVAPNIYSKDHEKYIVRKFKEECVLHYPLKKIIIQIKLPEERILRFLEEEGFIRMKKYIRQTMTENLEYIVLEYC